MTPENFKTTIAYLSKYLKYDMDKERTTMYWNMLKHLTDEKFQHACETLVKEFIPTQANPFPLVSHILAACGEAGETKVLNLITQLKKCIHSVGRYESISFGCPAFHSVIQAFGGWAAICAWPDKEWDINEGRFTEAYRAALSSGVKGPDHLAGIHEQGDGKYRIAHVTSTGTMQLSAPKSPLQITAAEPPPDDGIADATKALLKQIEDRYADTESINQDTY